MDLEPSTNFTPSIDQRPRMANPLPVRLICVEDVTIEAAAGQEQSLDEFYVGLLEFERESPADPPVYRADNARLRVDVKGGPVHREDYRPVGIIVQSLLAIEHKLIDRQIEYTRQKTTQAGQESLVLTDPAGNWVQITEHRQIR